MATITAHKTSTFHVEASQIIDAPPKDVYTLLSDYRVGHPAILPKPYFTRLTVEEGGIGAGTVVLTEMRVWGKEFRTRQRVTEPEPGRVLAETDVDTGQYTQFVFEPVDGGQKTHLIIASEFPTSPGFIGWLTRLTQPGIVRRIYQQELQNITQYFNRKTVA